MPESTSSKFRRYLRMVDNSIYNAIADLFPYYAVLVHADPVLGAMCESLILGWEDDRRHLHDVYMLAWEQDHEQFSTIGEAARLVQKERNWRERSKRHCQDYSRHWDRLVRESSRLLEKRAEALQQLSDSHRRKPKS